MTAPSPTRGRTRRLLLLQLVLWPALLIGAELAHRGWLAVTGDGYDAAATAEELRRTAGAMTTDLQDPGGERRAQANDGAATVLHPYAGFVPGYAFEEHARELRRTNEGLDEPNEFRLLVLGGSVAAGFADPKSAGVREFVRVLKEDPAFADRPVRVLRHAIASHKQPQQLLLAAYLFATGVEPHAVLNLDGFNEMALALGNADKGVHPSFPSHAKWSGLAGASTAEVLVLAEHVGRLQDLRERAVELTDLAVDGNLVQSSLLGRFFRSRLRRVQREYQEASAAYLQAVAGGTPSRSLTGPRFPAEADALAAAAGIWERSSRSLAALCEVRGTLYVHALQPTLHDEGSKSPTDDELRTGRAKDTWKRGAREGYPLLRAAGARLADDGIAFHDASGVFREVEETLYYDACHFNQKGNGLLGRDLGRAFLAALAAEASGAAAARSIQGPGD